MYLLFYVGFAGVTSLYNLKIAADGYAVRYP